MSTDQAVILTQEQTNNELLGARLDELGIKWQSYPCIATRMLPYSGNEMLCGRALENFKVIAFTSKRGVLGMVEVRERLQDSQPLIACVGDSTALAVKTELGLSCTIKPKLQTSVGLTQAIVNRIGEPAALLHPRGNKTSGEFKLTMEGQGWEVCDPVVYENLTPEMEPLADLQNAVLVFASPSAVSRFFETNPDDVDNHRCVAIGPTTSKSLERRGVKHVTESNQPTTDGLVKAIQSTLQQGIET